jgi:hypothetical protein
VGKEGKALYAASSVKTWRGTLHLLLEDAMDDELISFNPATKRRGRGKRAGRSRDRGPEKVVTDPFGILLIAERTSLLSGRDDEFVAVVTKGYTGMRRAEIVGLETEFIRTDVVRVEWQLYELDSGEFERCPPKDDSYRTIDAPAWLTRLWSGHIARSRPTACLCHGKTYMFRGQAVSRTGETGAKVVDVARRAGVSTGTVSNVLNRPDVVAEATRARVQEAMMVSGSPAVGERWTRPRTGDGTGLLRGSLRPPPPAGIRRRRRRKRGRCPCSVNPGTVAHFTAEWEAALDARLAMFSTSPVAVLNDLLQERLRVRRSAPSGREIPRSSPRFLPRGPLTTNQGHLLT